MSTQTTDYLDIIERLPAGAKLELPDIAWEEYEQLLSRMEDFPGHRLSYNRGRLVIVGPSAEHEDYKDFIYSLVRLISLETDVALETRGTTTFKSKKLLKGAEPDTCFYVQSAPQIIGKRRINLDTDPPPDVVVEIDLSSGSLYKFPIYAALRVPEIWRYDGHATRFYKLAGENYEVIQHSLAFPLLTAEDLARYVELSKVKGQSVALRAFRQTLRPRATS
ncbi:MAG TPA: Uma2 family endonuclease [Pyrinomonadaceae bacterium]|jgi:Uma2 family endonuclease